MELIENVLQFLVTLLGFCLSVSYYRRRGRQAYFLLACFYGCVGLPLLDALSHSVFKNAPGVLCIRVWMDCKYYLSSYSTIYSVR